MSLKGVEEAKGYSTPERGSYISESYGESIYFYFIKQKITRQKSVNMNNTLTQKVFIYRR